MEPIKNAIKRTKLANIYIWLKNLVQTKRNSQSNEALLIWNLIERYRIEKSFVEFGFSGWEFNCIELAGDQGSRGLLIDGDQYNISIASQIFRNNIEAIRLWIDLESLEIILNFSRNINLGILSIDVDGNDYWFL